MIMSWARKGVDSRRWNVSRIRILTPQSQGHQYHLHVRFPLPIFQKKRVLSHSFTIQSSHKHGLSEPPHLYYTIAFRFEAASVGCRASCVVLVRYTNNVRPELYLVFSVWLNVWTVVGENRKNALWSDLAWAFVTPGPTELEFCLGQETSMYLPQCAFDIDGYKLTNDSDFTMSHL